MPASHEIEIQADTRYLHITSNETIGGIRMSEWPDVGVPMVADLSSEYMARPIPWEKFDLVYGGVQIAPWTGMSLVKDTPTTKTGFNEKGEYIHLVYLQ